MKKEIKSKKKFHQGLRIVSFVALGVIILLGILAFINSSSSGINRVDIGSTQNSESNVPTKSCQNIQIPYEEQEEYLKSEYYTESVPYTSQECEAKKLAYKKETGQCKQRVDNFFASDEPAKYDCTITNLDDEGGNFYITIGFNVQGQKMEETQNSYIYPQSSHNFIITRDALIDNCYCSETNLPTKQVCRDVIKYQDVQRERQVTAFRPITKYRTEQQCA